MQIGNTCTLYEHLIALHLHYSGVVVWVMSSRSLSNTCKRKFKFVFG